MNIQELYTLLKKYREQRYTPEEWEHISRWYEQFSDEAERIPGVPGDKLEMLFARIEGEIVHVKSHRQLKKYRFRWYSGIAAALVICLFIGWYFLNQEDRSKIETKERISSILPGHKQAELILGDGCKVLLDSMTVIKAEGGQLIKNRASAVLDYSVMRESTAQEVYNTIVVPSGGEYQLILADGTQVWLNSASVLKYPVTFVGDTREVILEGEAYFKVTKSSTPFLVKTAELNVRVLGTSFNVSAYGNDECVMTTLVSGSVEVGSNHGKDKYRIHPGNILTYTRKTEQVVVEECDTELYTSWITGEFKFRDMCLANIMKKLNRWYDCQIVFEDESLKNLHFSGAAEKDRPISYLLEMIEAVTDVSFEIQDKTITIRHK